jgi:hypothetical protein
MSITRGVSFPLLDGSGVLGGVEAEPCGGLRPAVTPPAGARSGSYRERRGGVVRPGQEDFAITCQATVVAVLEHG